MTMIRCSDKSWSLLPDKEYKSKDIEVPTISKIISSPKAWEQYMSNDLYVIDKAIRELLEELSQTPGWKKVGGRGSAPNRMYTSGMIFERLYNRKYEPKDKKTARIIGDVCAYYAMRIVRNTRINGKLIKNKNIYVFSPNGIPNVKRKPKIPYSLKLRLEYFAEEGIIPTGENMALNERDLLNWAKDFRARNLATNKRSLHRTIKMRQSLAKRIGRDDEDTTIH